jgi:NADPH:quinone reductase-like Zn-dependent oxidoreductase
MRAFVLTEFGADPELADIEIPEPTEGEVRVRVHAASVNGFDLSVAKSYLKDMMEHRFPVVLGKDFAGVVDAVGPRVAGYAIGDRVFGVVTKPYLGDGSFAEYVTVATEVGLAKLPESIDFTTGAALGLAGAAALQAFDAAQIQTGENVLVVGATGGVGNQLVQLAKNAGATVVATAATDGEKDLVATLGADVTVDHTGDLVEAVRATNPEGVDVVFHFAGDPTQAASLVRPGCRFVSTMVQADQFPVENVSVHGIYTQPDQAKLDRLATHAAQGTTSVKVQDSYALDQVSDAFAAFAGGTLGKLVVTTA